MNRHSGFTLIEVVTVLTLLGIVVAVTVPAMRDLGGNGAQDVASREMIRILRSARAVALGRGSQATLLIDPARGRYWLDLDSGGRQASLESGQISLPQGAEIATQARRLSFRFWANGRAEGDSFYLRTPTGALAVAIDPWNGEPSVVVRR